MKKKCLFVIFAVSIMAVMVFAGNSNAFEDANLDLIEPTVDIDFVVLREDQSKTVTADLSFSGDFEIIPVALVGNGNFSANIARTSTRGELIYISFLGFGLPWGGINMGFTPVTVRVSSTISDVDPWAVGLVIHGILFSMEDPPWSYNVTLNF